MKHILMDRNVDLCVCHLCVYMCIYNHIGLSVYVWILALALSEEFDFQRTTFRYIPEDSTLHNHRCKNLRSYNYG
jgi:hypothetical protein